MAGKPWEKYQAQTETTSSGPWTKYQSEQPKKEEPGMFARALEKVDQYSGAPVREFVGALQDNKSIKDAAKDAYHQIGKPTSEAPSPQEIVDKDRFVGKIVNSPAFRASYADTPMTWGPRALMAPFVGGWEKSGELVGKAPKAAAIVGVGAATDPIAHVPVTPFVKPAQKAYGLLPEAIKSPLKTGGNIVASGAEYLTGVPKAAWKNYIENPQAIKALEEAHGPNVADAADSLRESWGAAIGQKKQTLGQIIDEALSAAPKKAKIDPAEIIGPLNEAKKNLNPNIKEHAAAIAQIDDHINQVRALAPEGKLTAKDAYDLQKTMQGRGRASYAKDGAMFNPAPESAKAARGAAAETRKIVNSLLPDVAKANEALSELHGIDDTMRASLYKPGTSNAGLMTTLSKTQTPEAQQLEALGRWIDRDVVQEAKDFATYKRFQGMGNDASDQTGKAVYRMIGGSILGGAAGGTSGDPMNALIGAGAGALSTNPRRIRNLIDAALAVKNKGAGTFGKGGLLDEGAEQVRPFLTALERRINPTLEKGVKTAEDFILDEAGQFTPGQIKGFLKREGTYDLKKAREAAGPAKGLLPSEGGNPAGAFPEAYPEVGSDMSRITMTNPKVSESDRVLVDELLKKARSGKELTDKERQFFRGVEERARREDPKLMSYIQSEWSKAHAENWAKNNERVTQAHEASKPAEQPRGLLTNLNVERGPVKELPEAGKVVAEMRPTNSGMRVDRPKGGGTVDYKMGKIKLADGVAEPGQVIVSPTGNRYRVESVDPETGYASLYDMKYRESSEIDVGDLADWKSYSKELETQAAARKSAQKAAEAKKVVSVDVPGAPKRGRAPDIKPEMAYKPRAVPAAETKQTGPDIGEVWNSPSGKEYTVIGKEVEDGKTYLQVKHLDTSGGRTDGQMVTSWELADDPKVFYGRKSRGESGPPGKKELIDDLMSGKKKVPGISVQRGKPNPNQGLIDDLWANRAKPDNTPIDVPLDGSVTLKKAQTNSAYNSNPKFEVAEALDDGSGYLVFDPENNRTFEVKHEDISGVFNNKGKPVKPKSKPTKPKGKK